MPNNILITGRPRSGKTTLVEDVLKEVNKNKIGFLTREVREKGKRVGFDVVLSSGETFPLANVNFHSPYRVSKYFVDVKRFESALSELFDFSRNDFLHIDEIGKMELFSNGFKKMVIKYLDSDNLCLAAISSVFNDDFVKTIKNRDDIMLFELSTHNREAVAQRVKELVSKLCK